MLKAEFCVLRVLLGAPGFLHVLRVIARGPVLLFERMRSGKREGRLAFLPVKTQRGFFCVPVAY